MARVAHELTTPVSLISGSLENLQESLASLVRYVEATDKYLTADTEIARLRADLRLDHRLRHTEGLLQICSEGARRLTHVVAQLRGGLPPAAQLAGRVTDLRSILDGAVAMAAHGRARQPMVVTDCLPSHIPVSVNPQSLGQVLLNVVRNAFDALEGRADARVDIEARVQHATAAQPSAVRALVSIRDNGPGIPADHRAHIFAEGFSTKSTRGGLGLGLAISREIMTSLGGSIELLPPGEGTEFLICIPMAEAPDAAGGAGHRL
jgi:signal transduction histidine kinase